MDLAGSTLEMDREQAREAYLDYAEAVKRRHDAEDAAIAKGYKALAEGKRLINLRDAMRRGGVDDRGRPRLAVAPALAEWVWMARSRTGAVSFAPVAAPRNAVMGSWRAATRHVQGSGQVNFPEGTLAELGNDWDYWKLGRWANRAMVPIVPPALRPARAMTGYHILFEAEWEQVPPVDPALIRHLAGDLWVLLAEWDLTDLERAVLAARIS